MTDWTYTATSKICDKCGYTTFLGDAEPHECLDGLLSLRARLEAAEARIESLEHCLVTLAGSYSKLLGVLIALDNKELSVLVAGIEKELQEKATHVALQIQN